MKEKYLKYKMKYLELKNQIGGFERWKTRFDKPQVLENNGIITLSPSKDVIPHQCLLKILYSYEDIPEIEFTKITNNFNRIAKERNYNWTIYQEFDIINGTHTIDDLYNFIQIIVDSINNERQVRPPPRQIKLCVEDIAYNYIEIKKLAEEVKGLADIIKLFNRNTTGRMNRSRYIQNNIYNQSEVIYVGFYGEHLEEIIHTVKDPNNKGVLTFRDPDFSNYIPKIYSKKLKIFTPATNISNYRKKIRLELLNTLLELCNDHKRVHGLDEDLPKIKNAIPIIKSEIEKLSK